MKLYKAMSILNTLHKMITQKKNFKISTEDTISLLFNSILRRPPDIKTLVTFTQMVDGGQDLRHIVDIMFSSNEYKESTQSKATEIVNNPQIDSHYNWDPNKNINLHGVNKSEIQKLIIFKLDHIGDFVLAIDSFVKLRRFFDRSAITCVCGPWNKEIAERLGLFDQIITFDFFAQRADEKRSNNKVISIEEFSQQYDLAIDLRVATDTRVVFDSIKSRYYCGYDSGLTHKNLDICLSRSSLSPGSNKDYTNKHQIQMIANAVIDAFHESATTEILQNVYSENVTKNSAIDYFTIIVQPFSGASAKNWPLDNYARLVEYLLNEYKNIQIIVLGKLEEMNTDDIKFKQVLDDNRVINLVGKTDLNDAFSIIARGDLYIGNDTGFSHFASALGKPSIVLFSGVDITSLYAPTGPCVTILKNNVSCSPCYIASINDCEKKHICMNGLTVDVVKHKVSETLSRLLGPRNFNQ